MKLRTDLIEPILELITANEFVDARDARSSIEDIYSFLLRKLGQEDVPGFAAYDVGIIIHEINRNTKGAIQFDEQDRAFVWPYRDLPEEGDEDYGLVKSCYDIEKELSAFPMAYRRQKEYEWLKRCPCGREYHSRIVTFDCETQGFHAYCPSYDALLDSMGYYS